MCPSFPSRRSCPLCYGLAIGHYGLLTGLYGLTIGIYGLLTGLYGLTMGLSAGRPASIRYSGYIR